MHFLSSSSSSSSSSSYSAASLRAHMVTAMMMLMLMMMLTVPSIIAAPVFNQARAVDSMSNGTNAACSPSGYRTDCGYVGIDQVQCESKGCCWSPAANLPWCFYQNAPLNAYTVKSIVKTAIGFEVALTLASSPGIFGPDVSNIRVVASYDTQTRLHVKIFDGSNTRWEVPSWITPEPTPPVVAAANPEYAFETANLGQPFYFAVTRVSDKSVLFNSSQDATFQFNNLIFEDQYLEISTQLPSSAHIYGIGEHVHPMSLDQRIYTLWSFDTPTPPNNNLYGTHPFYMDMRSSGAAHGVFLRNSNGMDVTLSGNSLTYRVIGGIFDFYFFLGPNPDQIVQQYTEVIGRPHMPPFWGLGFHQCRYGYHNLADLQNVVANYSANGIPLDTMWTDIDYMNQFKDFTWDPTNFPQSGMSSFVDQLHSKNMQYVVIVDPGISTTSGYAPYDQGLQLNLFTKKNDGQTNFVGKVWPGLTVFPDFFHPNASQWWENQVEQFLSGVSVDGLWIDMNEASNFCNGACDSPSIASSYPDGRLGFNPVSPPYAINNQQSHQPLNTKTIDTDAVHYGGILEYNVHSLFGASEAIATSQALESVRKQRSFVISRSTFAGSGAHTGHWTGDNHATWDDLYNSIPGILNFQMFGIPLVGSDICGFLGDTTEELCGRWMQLGAFYPFSRNHNDIDSQPQEPYRWASVAAISKTVLSIRYSLLPYWYTLFYHAHANGTTVVRPLFFEFPMDSNTFSLDKQFLVGPAILVTPVLTQGANTVAGYFPSSMWYDYYTQTAISQSQQAATITLSAPFSTINVHIRGGYIIPTQAPALTSAATRQSPVSLIVATPATGTATGDFYLDDGVSLDMSQYVYVSYVASFGQNQSGNLTATVTATGYATSLAYDRFDVLGVSARPQTVTLNGGSFSTYFFNSTSNVLSFVNVGTPVNKPFILTWSN